MACVRACCCCVNLRVGGILMGIMTLSLSVFSIVPMTISLINRIYLARVMTHLVQTIREEDEDGGVDSMAVWGKVDKLRQG